MTPRKGRYEGERPMYPHSEYIDQVYKTMDERKLSDNEARALLNARLFDSLIVEWLPQLRDILKGLKEGEPDFESTQVMIAQAALMAQAIGMELIIAKAEAQKVRVATDEQVNRILRVVVKKP